MKTTLCTALVVLVLMAFRMLFINPSWFFLPKNMQLWLYGKSYSAFCTR